MKLEIELEELKDRALKSVEYHSLKITDYLLSGYINKYIADELETLFLQNRNKNLEIHLSVPSGVSVSPTILYFCHSAYSICNGVKTYIKRKR